MITDGLSDYLFTAGMVANRNLNQTGTESENVYYVGNILIDAIRYNRNRLLKPIWFSVLGLQEGNYLLLTLNRRVLLNNKENLQQLMETLIEKSAGMPIVAPLHIRRKELSPTPAMSPKKQLSWVFLALLSIHTPSIPRHGVWEPTSLSEKTRFCLPKQWIH